ncbi:hypothetical protein DRW03_21370 [Corallococcus sp. H22C18031201]|nr:hypothetical protein DRW03_21370 [Corallococcus sp. H22C18031201]
MLTASTCPICRRPLARRAGAGRPLTYCTTQHCRTVLDLNRQRRRCARCAGRLPRACRLDALCARCVSEVARPWRSGTESNLSDTRGTP